MAKYGVECTIIYNGWAEIEAENEGEALAKIQDSLNYENLSKLPNGVEVGDVWFNFGEATADYVEKI